MQKWGALRPAFFEKTVLILTRKFRIFILPDNFQKIYRFLADHLIYKLSTIIIRIRLLVSCGRRQAAAEGNDILLCETVTNRKGGTNL